MLAEWADVDASDSQPMPAPAPDFCLADIIAAGNGTHENLAVVLVPNMLECGGNIATHPSFPNDWHCRCGSNNSAMFADIVPEELRSTVYAFDRSFEGGVAACAMPLVGEAWAIICTDAPLTVASAVLRTGIAAGRDSSRHAPVCQAAAVYDEADGGAPAATKLLLLVSASRAARMHQGLTVS